LKMVPTEKTYLASFQRSSLQLSPEIEFRLRALQQKGIDINQLLTQLLDKREQSIESQKAEICTNLPKTPQSRHIPSKTCQVLETDYGSKCAVRRCPWMADEIHHTVPFALNPYHDPHFMAPLCHEHHTIAHSVNEKVCVERNQAIQAKMN